MDKALALKDETRALDQSRAMVKNTISSDEILAVKEENSCDGQGTRFRGRKSGVRRFDRDGQQTLSSDEISAVKEKTRAVADNTLSSDGKIDIASQPSYC